MQKGIIHMKRNLNNKKEELPLIHAVGRRKEAVARIRLYPLLGKKEITTSQGTFSKGQIIVNNKPIDQVFSQTWHKILYLGPFQITDTEGDFVTTIRVSGGGSAGQLEAIILGIARALQKHDIKHHTILKKHGFLTRDSRVRQRRMIGMGGKSRRKKQSPKR